ncbi:GTP-binding protein [Denitratisoma sp. DHT3]|uniref:YdcH family protein n=1 Tax=Denitratisoma sp. DHT3 TaxID=1981880 RepID=UPI0011987C78|nr:YdcH family protein [Denitratisoma sp. DHT3]QDX81122.1 GTP-binding protein [Denitratisoma sp. DHT3]
MTIEHHDLHHEFPEFKDSIHRLKVDNHHFARLFDEYHLATSEVERLEGLGVPVDDLSIEDMKKKRLKLKDELYAMLREHRVS